ncbi:MAG: twin-arginine translocase subunit TatC [Pseudomonadota bacterium]|nr:twin-arginine translocase subunit TatC [Pseudomonadota bacterium]
MVKWTYLHELRARLIQSLLVIGVLFVVCCLFANPLYHMLALPLLQQMPAGNNLIATQVAATLLVPFKFALIVAIVLAMPYLLYQFWSFIAPALYKQERRLLWSVLFASSTLFYMGIAFAYGVVFPLMFSFFISTAPTGVEVRPDISQYLDFTLSLFMAFGVIFEVPMLTWLLARLGVVTVEQLRAARPYVIVGAFIVGMLLSPPDVVSQIILAVPICLLYEMGLWCASWSLKPKIQLPESSAGDTH